MTPARASASSVLALAVLACTLLVSGCGRREREVIQDVSALSIARYRLNIDEKSKVARIVAEVKNNGDRHVREAAVTAILKGPGDEKRGINRVVVADIAPGKTRVFSLTVTTRGRERGVEFIITPPDVDVELEEEET